MTENGAILRYLSRAFPEKASSYYPDDMKVQAKIDMLVDFINTGICTYLPRGAYPSLGFPCGPGEVSSMEETKEHTAKSQAETAAGVVEILEKKYVGIFLKDTKYLLSDTPTIADFRFAPMLDFIKVVTPLPPKIVEYYEAMNELPGFTEACAAPMEYAKPHWK